MARRRGTWVALLALALSIGSLQSASLTNASVAAKPGSCREGDTHHPVIEFVLDIGGAVGSSITSAACGPFSSSKKKVPRGKVLVFTGTAPSSRTT